MLDKQNKGLRQFSSCMNTWEQQRPTGHRLMSPDLNSTKVPRFTGSSSFNIYLKIGYFDEKDLVFNMCKFFKIKNRRVFYYQQLLIGNDKHFTPSEILDCKKLKKIILQGGQLQDQISQFLFQL